MDNAKIGIGEYLYYCPKKNLLWSKSGLVMEYINLAMFLNTIFRYIDIYIMIFLEIFVNYFFFFLI